MCGVSILRPVYRIAPSQTSAFMLSLSPQLSCHAYAAAVTGGYLHYKSVRVRANGQ